MNDRGMGRIYRRKLSKFWWVQYHVRGKVHRESSGSESRNAAAKLLRKRLAEVSCGKPVGVVVEKTTFEDMARMIVDDYLVNGRKSLARVEDSLLHLRPAFGNSRAIDITTDRINRYIKDRLEEGAAPATVLQEIAALRRSVQPWRSRRGSWARSPTSLFPGSRTPGRGSSRSRSTWSSRPTSPTT